MEVLNSLLNTDPELFETALFMDQKARTGKKLRAKKTVSKSGLPSNGNTHMSGWNTGNNWSLTTKNVTAK